MFSNYLKVIIRNLWRFKGYSFINLFGMALGMAVCLLVFLFVRYERNYDAMYGDHIYRICTIQQEQSSSTPEKIAKTMFPMGPVLQQEIPGIKDYARIMAWDKVPLQKQDRTGTMATLLGTDASFLRLFKMHLLHGNEATALTQPGSIVLTQSLARTLFGSSNPIGQMLRHEGRDTVNFTVTGILPDVSPQSHLQFDALSSMATYELPAWSGNWEQSWIFTYLQLEEHTDARVLQDRLPAFLQQHLKAPRAALTQLFLQPLQNVHLYSGDILNDAINTQKFEGSYLPLLMAVGLFVLLLGIINYINLNTARLLTRAKEVGIRKTSGAGYREIIVQFFGETLAFCLLAFILALLFMLPALPFLGRLTGRDLHWSVLQGPVWMVVVLFVSGTGLLAGLLPAMAMARIQPVVALKGKLWTGHRSSLRSALVVLQFSISIGLSLAAVTVLRQLQYIQQHNPGFNKEGVIVLSVSYTDRQVEEGLMHKLRQIPGVLDVTGALRRLGSTIDQNEVVFTGNRGDHKTRCANMYIDYNYLSFYRMKLLAGRNLSSTFSADRDGRSYIINETLARQLMPYSSSADTSVAGLIGKNFRYTYEDSSGTIVGVVQDFNFGSLHERIEPLCMSYQYEYYFIDLSIRADMSRLQPVLAQAEQAWKTFLPAQQFSWYFLDDHLQQLYRSDRQTGAFIAIFAAIAFIISVLGLTGVAAFVIERRTKEIGVRKILGATVASILILLSKEFLLLVFASICVALPAAWWATNAWLQEFAYRVAVDGWIFAFVAAGALLVAAITVNIQATKAATANPVNSLRLE